MQYILVNHINHCVLFFILSILAACGSDKNEGGDTISVLECPNNYVRIPALSGYTDEEFCVSKYEMTNAGGTPVSVPNSVNYFAGSKNNILNLCATIGPEYDLITNDQWQTLARNIELVAENWRTGVIGQGVINRGHYRNNPNNDLPANADDNVSCSGTTVNCDLDTWHARRRTHRPSTGDVIWDVGGNRIEWVKDDNTGNVNYGAVVSITQITNTSHPTTGSLSESRQVRTARGHFGVALDYPHLNTAGTFGRFGTFETGLPGSGTSIVLRGGYRGYNRSGIFLTTLQNNQTSVLPATFRCVYRP